MKSKDEILTHYNNAVPVYIFEGAYNDWRVNRIRVMEKNLEPNYFVGKSILELGAGMGQTSEYFAKKGSVCTATDGREDHVAMMRAIRPEIRSLLIDQDAWYSEGSELEGEVFDVIIHWGVLYHLSKWKEDLQETVKHMHNSSILCLETEVLNTEADIEVNVVENNNWDQALNANAVRASAVRIEKHMLNLGLLFTRYDDYELNAGMQKYDWAVDPNAQIDTSRIYNSHDYPNPGLRRFWIARKA